MAYSTAKVSLVTSTIEGQGPQRWSMINSDSIATMLGSGYITDATKLGMRIGDLVELASGTFNTAVYPASGAATADVGEAADFTDTPPVRAVVSVGSISSGAATLTDNLQIGGATNAKVGFFGTTPAVQPTSASEAAVTVSTITTAATTTTPWGYATSTQADNLAASVKATVTLVNQLRADLVTLGLVKGS